MKRALRILLLALFLAPQLGQALLPSERYCEETRDCCEPKAACDERCTPCVCCAGGPGDLANAVKLGCVEGLRVKTVVATPAAPMSPPPFDILHVPKSL